MHSLIFPFVVSNVVNLVFHTVHHFIGSGRKLSRFCKMARRSKVVGPRWVKQISTSFTPFDSSCHQSRHGQTPS